MSVRYPLLAVLLAAAARSEAQDASPIVPPSLSQVEPVSSSEPEISLEELLRRAQSLNPQPRIAASTVAAARSRSQAARSTFNPTLQLVPGVGGTSASRDEEIILSQPVDLFGQRRSAARVFDAQVRQAEAQAEVTNRSLIVQVKNAATELFAAQEAESLGATQVELARAFRDAANRKAQAGDAPPVQTQRAQLELERAEAELDQTRAERLARRATLNQLIGSPPEAPLRVALPETGMLSLSAISPTVPSASTEVPSSPAQPIAPPIIGTPIVGASSQIGSELVATRSALLPGALQRADIVAAEAGVVAARAQATAIGRQRRPLLEIQARRGGVFDSSATSLRAVITVPLLDFGSLKREQRAAEFEAKAQEGQVTLLRSQAAAQVESALVRLNQNRRTVERYRDSLVPQTLDLLRKTQVGYGAGASTYLEVLEAQRAARQIQNEYLQALVGLRTGEVALESAIGSPFPSVPTPPFSSTPVPTAPQENLIQGVTSQGGTPQ